MTAPAGSPDPLALPLAFIGPMAAGKTKIARRVARGLAVPFIDTDQRIVERYGPIAEIFAREGEEFFRVIEREVVAEALAEEAVVSLGGGAVLDAGTRADLGRCTVVYLSVDAGAAAKRIRGRKRPLLANGIEDWQRIFSERRPVYESLADVHFDTSTRSVGDIADDILTWTRETP